MLSLFERIPRSMMQLDIENVKIINFDISSAYSIGWKE